MMYRKGWTCFHKYIKVGETFIDIVPTERVGQKGRRDFYRYCTERVGQTFKTYVENGRRSFY